MKNATLFLALFVAHASMHSQDADPRYEGETVFPFGVIEELHSDALNEDRVLKIYLPQGYDPKGEDIYPTIYVLDGSAHEDFPHIAGLVQFMNMYNLTPKAIVVGVANVNRYRDFTFPSVHEDDIKLNPANGGSPKFIDFLENEVQPFVKSNYRTNGQKAIIGQSLGGLLATEILMKKPHLFDDHIIVSPSLWWNHQKLVSDAADYFKSNLDLKKRIFVSLGKEHPEMHEVADKLVNAIRDSNNNNIELYYTPLLEENHATILHKAVYVGLETLNKTAKKEKDFLSTTYL
jgi:predicted alpha/beta superfamily hydrolase